MIVTDLQAETTYSVTVAAYTTKGDGARSKPKLITTTGAGKRAPPTEKISLEKTQLCLIIFLFFFFFWHLSS